jgi:hypothetical protein
MFQVPLSSSSFKFVVKFVVKFSGMVSAEEVMLVCRPGPNMPFYVPQQ